MKQHKQTPYSNPTLTANINQKTSTSGTSPYLHPNYNKTTTQKNSYYETELYKTKLSLYECQTSRRKNQVSAQQLVERYEQIEHILVAENQNLKQQNQYLINEVRRANTREKLFQEKLQKLNHYAKWQDHYTSKMQQDLLEVRDYIKENVQTLQLLLKSDNFQQLKSILRQFVAGITDILCLHNAASSKHKKYVPYALDQAFDTTTYLLDHKSGHRKFQKFRSLDKESFKVDHQSMPEDAKSAIFQRFKSESKSKHQDKILIINPKKDTAKSKAVADCPTKTKIPLTRKHTPQ